jgi:rhamnose utilization protein RhaD (predicted bifunctional aldolase and dehydrogenase)
MCSTPDPFLFDTLEMTFVSETNPTATDLIARSNRLGADARNTNYAGGNTSANRTTTA